MPNSFSRIQRADFAERSGEIPIRNGTFTPCSASRAMQRRTTPASMQNCVCTNSQPAASLAFSDFGPQPAGGSIGTSAAAMKNSALPATFLPVGNSPWSRIATATAVSAAVS